MLGRYLGGGRSMESSESNSLLPLHTRLPLVTLTFYLPLKAYNDSVFRVFLES